MQIESSWIRDQSSPELWGCAGYNGIVVPWTCTRPRGMPHYISENHWQGSSAEEMYLYADVAEIVTRVEMVERRSRYRHASFGITWYSIAFPIKPMEVAAQC